MKAIILLAVVLLPACTGHVERHYDKDKGKWVETVSGYDCSKGMPAFISPFGAIQWTQQCVETNK